jgi:trans-aconitate 2-methyltransferase
MAWNPEQYTRYSAPRLRPALDLMSRLGGADPRTIIDLGCGTGNITRMLAESFPAARVVIGVDNSPEMLDKARGESSRVTWIEADVSSWVHERPVELLFSNACLQWLPDHTRLFPHLARQVASGGMMAVQMPRGRDMPSQVILRELLRDGPWGNRLEGRLSTDWVLSGSEYYDLLADTAREVDIWETDYLHVLDGEDAVFEWTKGTSLIPVFQVLEGEERDRFVEEYKGRLRSAYPRRDDGKTLFPFHRIFMIATI